MTELTPNGPKPRVTFQCKGLDQFQSAEGDRTDQFSSIQLKNAYFALNKRFKAILGYIP